MNYDYDPPINDTICNDSVFTTNSGFERMSHPFTTVGVNNIYVIVIDDSTGCQKKLDFPIHVQGVPEINNVFSPNGDDINDYFISTKLNSYTKPSVLVT